MVDGDVVVVAKGADDVDGDNNVISIIGIGSIGTVEVDVEAVDTGEVVVMGLEIVDGDVEVDVDAMDTEEVVMGLEMIDGDALMLGVWGVAMETRPRLDFVGDLRRAVEGGGI